RGGGLVVGACLAGPFGRAGGVRVRGAIPGQRGRVIHHGLAVPGGRRDRRCVWDAAMRVGMGGAREPLIGISAYCEVARWGLWDMPASLIPQNYADSVAAAGRVPGILPPVPRVDSP